METTFATPLPFGESASSGVADLSSAPPNSGKYTRMAPHIPRLPYLGRAKSKDSLDSGRLSDTKSYKERLEDLDAANVEVERLRKLAEKLQQEMHGKGTVTEGGGGAWVISVPKSQCCLMGAN